MIRSIRKKLVPVMQGVLLQYRSNAANARARSEKSVDSIRFLKKATISATGLALLHSYRRATMGLRPDARRAGT